MSGEGRSASRRGASGRGTKDEMRRPFRSWLALILYNAVLKLRSVTFLALLRHCAQISSEILAFCGRDRVGYGYA